MPRAWWEQEGGRTGRWDGKGEGSGVPTSCLRFLVGEFYFLGPMEGLDVWEEAAPPPLAQS